jgi:hypothetical protein
MMSDVSSLIVAIAGAPDDTVRARLLRTGGKDLLADPEAIGAVVDVALDSTRTEAAQAAEMLLGAALDEARMAAENGAPEGPALIDALAAWVTARDGAKPLTPLQRLRLAQCHARAGLAPPPFAMLSPETMPETMTETMEGALPAEMPDLDSLLGPLLKEIGDNSLQVHTALAELTAGLPPEPAALMVSMIVARPGAMEARLGLHWLLDPRPELRLAAATALVTRAEAGTLAPGLAALLPALRKVMPADATRAALDGAIRAQMRRGAAAAPAAKIHRAAASLPDGAGAQSLVAAVQIGGRRAIAMAMLKQGQGLKDAFVIPCDSATAQKQMLVRVLGEIETFDLPPGALTTLIAHGLGEGAARGAMPPPGFVDLLELFGPDSLAPRGGAATDILDGLGAAQALADLPAAQRLRLLKASAGMVTQFEQADSWFEDTGPLRDAIARARTDAGRAAAVWKHVETRRGWWARHFALCAAVLKPADVAPDLWQSCAAVAEALLATGSLKRIPVMATIVEMTLGAEAARGQVPRPGSFAGAQTDIRAVLADEGMTPAYLQGYLTAVVIAPQEPPPEAWLVPLIGGIEFPGDGTLDRVLDLIRSELEQLDRTTGEPQGNAARIAALDDEDLCDWANGFDDLVEATPGTWPARRLAAEDKRVLRAIAEIADGGTGGALRAILPAWLAQRHARRG